MSKKPDIPSNMFEKLHHCLIKASVNIIRDYEEIQHLQQIDSPRKEKFVDASIEKFTLVLMDKLSLHLPKFEFIVNEEELATDSTLIIDSINGKGNFLRGIKDFATCIALFLDKVKVLEVIHAPIHQVTYHTTKGENAYLFDPFMRKRRLLVSKPSLEGKSIIGVDVNIGNTSHLGEIRSIGCPALAFCYVATGNWDAAIVHGTHPAGNLIVQEAGGFVYSKDAITIASNGIKLNFP